MSRSLAVARRERKALDKMRRDEEIAKNRAKIAELRRAEESAKVERRQRLHGAREECVNRAVAAKERAQEAYREAVRLAREAKEAAKQAERDRCSLSKAHVKEEA